jgi:endonuclease YncB( thermonuclease family)
MRLVRNNLKVIKKAFGLFRPSAFFVGVFVVSHSNVAFSLELSCHLQGVAERVTLARVIDGDTLWLKDGRKLRIIGINAPEKTSGKRLGQPLAQEATVATRQFFAGSATIWIKPGIDGKDRYKRSLVHAYREDGGNLAEFLLKSGLAFHIAIPPNLGHYDCFSQAEHSARIKGHGLWVNDYYQPKPAELLTMEDNGFKLIAGRVTAINKAGSSWWIELGDHVSLRLANKDRKYFGGMLDKLAVYPKIEVRGWLIWRGTHGGHPPMFMHLRHPGALRILID